MKSFDISIKAIAASLGLAFSTVILAAPDAFTEIHDFEPGQTLNLDFVSGGSVSIEPWDQQGIEVTYYDELGLDRYEFDFEPQPDGLSISAKLLGGYNSSGLHFDIRAPRELDLEVASAGGSITLSGLAGRFRGKTGGGPIELENLQGEVSLTTGGGRIEVRNSILDGRVGTGGGKVLISDVEGDIEGHSGGGNVTYRNVTNRDGSIASPNRRRLDDATENTVLISNAGGGIDIDAAPEGADVSTGGGRINVDGANRFVAAHTGGGDVRIKLEEGWVNASTGAGELDVSVSRNANGNGDIELITGLGDVVLTLPADFSMALQVVLGVTNNTDGGFDIRSDFPIDVTREDKWDYSHGTPRRYILGDAQVNGGRHKVRIHTTNGDVTIRRQGG